MSKELSHFSISSLLDGLYQLRTYPGDSALYRERMRVSREKIIAELESRPVKELVQALIAEAVDR